MIDNANLLAESPALKASSEGETTAEYDLRALKSARIMLVDDEPTTLEVLQLLLEEEGYEHFIPIEDSRRALEMIAQERPDALLLDLLMPNMGGFDILKELRQDRRLRHLPVIILTSSADAETKLRALELGATDFLAKPVDRSELALRLRNTLAAKVFYDRLTFFDALTSLPNRRLFLDRLRRSLAHAAKAEHPCALLRLDVDRFKRINDVLGPNAADALIGAVARRLNACIRASDSSAPVDSRIGEGALSRFGGDEFALLMPDLESADAATQVAKRLLATFEQPFRIKAQELAVTPSIGIALYPDDGDDVETLLKHAESAVTQAKQQGRNRYQFFSSAINARAKERHDIEQKLRHALENGELEIYYQPKVDVQSGRIIGAEALLRWNDPQTGLVSPGKFIPVAEDSGLILPIGSWVLSQACREVASWRAAGFQEFSVAVNVSSMQFEAGQVTPAVREALAESGLPGACLVLELTESLMMERPEESLDALLEVKETGIRLALDDFGTGFSSLSYLTRFPFDEIKIDRAFVQNLPSGKRDASIVTAIVAMSHGLGLNVVAEGVENEGQRNFLTGLACNHYQGFLHSRPIPAAEMFALLRDSTRVGGENSAA